MMKLRQIKNGIQSQSDTFENPPDWWWREAVQVLLDKIEQLEDIQHKLILIHNGHAEDDNMYADNGQDIRAVALEALELMDKITEAR